MTDNPASKITASELEIMKLLWHTGDALTVTEIREKLQILKGWEPATIKTLISRISEQEYSSWATEDLISRLYNGRARDLVAALVNSDGLTKDDL